MHSFREKPYLFLCFRCFFLSLFVSPTGKTYTVHAFVVCAALMHLRFAKSNIIHSQQLTMLFRLFNSFRSNSCVAHAVFHWKRWKKKFRYENCMILCRWFTTESCFSLLSLCVFIFTTIQNNLLYHFMHMNYHMNATIKNERKNEEFFYSKKKRNIKKCCRFI